MLGILWRGLQFTAKMCRVCSDQVWNKELPFRLPAKPQLVYAAQHGDALPYIEQRYKEQWEAQAERVAWRICKTWLEAQITLINLEQAKIEEIFLPYLVAGKNNETLYEVLKEKQFLLPDTNK